MTLPPNPSNATISKAITVAKAAISRGDKVNAENLSQKASDLVEQRITHLKAGYNAGHYKGKHWELSNPAINTDSNRRRWRYEVASEGHDTTVRGEYGWQTQSAINWDENAIP